MATEVYYTIVAKIMWKMKISFSASVYLFKIVFYEYENGGIGQKIMLLLPSRTKLWGPKKGQQSLNFNSPRLNFIYHSFWE